MSRDNEADATAPPKYSRYKSVRRAAKESPPAATPVVPEQSETVKRSMSRYHRSRTTPKQEQSSTQPLPAVPAAPGAHPQSDPSTYASLTAGTTELASSNQSHAGRHTVDGRRASGRLRETESERLQREAGEIHNRDEQRQRAQRQQEEEEQRVLRQAAEEKLTEQKRKDLERLEATLDAAVQGSATPRVASPAREKFAFFSRRRTQKKTTPSPAPTRKSSISFTRSSGSNDAPLKNNEALPHRLIEHGGGGAAPGVDAPISAVNSGERRVLIRYKQSSINLPITPDTTSVDIIHCAANIMSHNISPSSTVLLESYTGLGLERRVRHYEHIRDIMNSWDRDTQNALFLQSSDSSELDADLESSSVPRGAPADVTVYMYHSQKAGKWNKSHITLLSSGQIFMAKKAGAKLWDKDTVSLCHLSDFDIYTPTPAQFRKLKPPKKHCYAVKSQQKSTIFLSTENFVHFFSTDDKALSAKWHGAVQRWRSWYLVHKMGVGGKHGKKAGGPTTTVSTRPSTKGGPAQKAKVVADEHPYLIGSFQPLFGAETDRVDNRGDVDEYASEEENRPPQAPFHLRNGSERSSTVTRRETKRQPPPVSYRLPPDAEGEFPPSSLLGHSYLQRVKTQKEREAQQLQNSGPFTAGPSLLNGDQRSLSQRSARAKRPETSAASSSGNGTGPLKPLLDFTPQFKEAPQWDKAGKGRGVAPPSGVPLVQLATTPDTGAVDLPKTTALSRDAAAGRRPTTSGGSGRDGASAQPGVGANSRSIMSRGRWD